MNSMKRRMKYLPCSTIIYCLDGELGVGKTVFTQGFAKGLGIEEPINSPTFTIVQEYTQGRIPLYHFDVYRISDVSEMDEIGYEEYFYSDGVCLVEWGKLIDELFPDNTTYIPVVLIFRSPFFIHTFCPFSFMFPQV